MLSPSVALPGRSGSSGRHWLYLLRHIEADGQVPIAGLHVILGSAMEFRSPVTSVELHVDSSRANALHSAGADSTVEIEVEVLGEEQKEASKSFLFMSTVDRTSVVRLGSRLSSAYVSLPCDVLLSGAQEVELLAPIKMALLTSKWVEVQVGATRSYTIWAVTA